MTFKTMAAPPPRKDPEHKDPGSYAGFFLLQTENLNLGNTLSFTVKQVPKYKVTEFLDIIGPVLQILFTACHLLVNRMNFTYTSR